MNISNKVIILTALSALSISSFYLSLVLGIISLIPLGIALYDTFQKKHSLLRNFPLIGRLRWVFEHERTKIQQYFIEHDTNGSPYNREKRSDVYQKSKGDNNTTPFGTQLDVYKSGYEYIQHSLYPKDIKDVPDPKVTIGSKFCKIPQILKMSK